MTVPLNTANDIRSTDAAGRSRSEIARVLHVSRNTVAKYADMGDISPAVPMPQRRGRPALEGNEEWVAGVLEADLGAPRKQRHTARRIYDRLVAERGYAGSYSTVQRLVQFRGESYRVRHVLMREGQPLKSVRASDAQAAQFPILFLLKSS